MASTKSRCFIHHIAKMNTVRVTLAGLMKVKSWQFQCGTPARRRLCGAGNAHFTKLMITSVSLMMFFHARIGFADMGERGMNNDILSKADSLRKLGNMIDVCERRNSCHSSDGDCEYFLDCSNMDSKCYVAMCQICEVFKCIRGF